MEHTEKSRNISAMDMLNIKRACEALQDKELDRTLSWLIATNLENVSDQVKILQKAVKQKTEEYEKYEEKFFKLRVKHTDNDKAYYQAREGMVPDKDIVDMEAFREDLTKLLREYNNVIEDQAELIKENNEFFEDHKATLKYYEIPFDLIPESIKPRILFNLKPIMGKPDWSKPPSKDKDSKKKKKVKRKEKTEED